MSEARYAKSLRLLHWSMAVLILFSYLAIEQRGAFGRGTGRTILMQTHFWIGISIFALVWWRLTVRIRRGAPPITPPLPAWQAIPARLLHLALYAFFIVMPILGLMTVWTDGKLLYVPFTGIALPALMAENKDLAHQLEDLHGSIGEAFYWVIGLHIVAALYHHFFRKDDTLRRM